MHEDLLGHHKDSQRLDLQRDISPESIHRNANSANRKKNSPSGSPTPSIPRPTAGSRSSRWQTSRSSPRCAQNRSLPRCPESTRGTDGARHPTTVCNRDKRTDYRGRGRNPPRQSVPRSAVTPQQLRNHRLDVTDALVLLRLRHPFVAGRRISWIALPEEAVAGAVRIPSSRALPSFHCLVAISRRCGALSTPIVGPIAGMNLVLMSRKRPGGITDLAALNA